MSSLLELKNISFNAGLTTVIKHVNITIETSSITAFLGKSGGGKSAALKLAAGILQPTKGKVLFEGNDIGKMSHKEDLMFRRRTGFMFQDSALWENQDIYNNLDIPLRIHFPKMSPDKRKKCIEDQAALVGFTKPLNLRPAALSIGERKRIGMARALICQPEVLFLDDPTESLDEKSTELFYSLVKDFLADKKTLIYVSQDPKFIQTFQADKYYFEDGEVVDKILLNDNLMIDEDSFM